MNARLQEILEILESIEIQEKVNLLQLYPRIRTVYYFEYSWYKTIYKPGFFLFFFLL